MSQIKQKKITKKKQKKLCATRWMSSPQVPAHLPLVVRPHCSKALTALWINHVWVFETRQIQSFQKSPSFPLLQKAFTYLKGRNHLTPRSDQAPNWVHVWPLAGEMGSVNYRARGCWPMLCRRTGKLMMPFLSLA